MRRAVVLAAGMWRRAMQSPRVWMGYLLGLTFLGLGCNDFLKYAEAMKEPVNLLEGFVVTQCQAFAGRLWPLGYLLILADAPFIGKGTELQLYRSGRRIWNLGMLCYVLTQSLGYAVCLAVSSVLVSMPLGFWGKLWSGPVYLLAKFPENAAARKYHLFFEGETMMKQMTVPQAFLAAFVYLFCGLALMGVLLYVCSLMFGNFWGFLAVAAFHLGSIVLSFWVQIPWSPVYESDSPYRFWRYPCLTCVALFLMTVVSFFAAAKVEFSERQGGSQ